MNHEPMTAAWIQQALVPPEVYEFRLRIGVIPGQDHVQVMAEALDPTDGRLMEQASAPHVGLADLEQASTRLYERLLSWATSVRDAQDPF